MRERVDFERDAFLQPRLQLRVAGRDVVRHDAHWRTAIYLFEPIQNVRYA